MYFNAFLLFNINLFGHTNSRYKININRHHYSMIFVTFSQLYFDHIRLLRRFIFNLERKGHPLQKVIHSLFCRQNQFARFRTENPGSFFVIDFAEDGDRFAGNVLDDGFAKIALPTRVVDIETSTSYMNTL